MSPLRVRRVLCTVNFLSFLFNQYMLIYSTNKKIMGAILHEQFCSPFRLIRRFIRVVSSEGYSIDIKRSPSGSCYLFFSDDKGSSYCFAIRLSDHKLWDCNLIPAGVIADCLHVENLIRVFQKSNSKFKRMDEREYSYLWTNRPVS